MIYGAAYYPEHRPESCWESDLDLMAQAHINCLRVGEFAWSRFEPELGRFDFTWIDTFLDMAAERNVSLLLCPPLRTAPNWLVNMDPTIMIERDDGVRLTIGGRYTFCINHPVLLERGEALAEALSHHYGNDSRVVGWHLDNEHGCELDCHCPICTAKFRTWCNKRYGSIEELNRAWGLAFWGLQFQGFEQVVTPRVTHGGHGPGHLLAWRRFRSESTVNAVGRQAEAVRRHAQGQFVTTNNQPLWNFRTDYYAMDRHLDIAGTNYYPPYGEGARGLSLGLATCRGYKQRTFQVHELRNGPHMSPGDRGNTPAPGEVRKLVMHAVGNGADGTFFFRWDACPFGYEQVHGTLQGYNGRPKRVHAEAGQVGKTLERLGPMLKDTIVPAEIALLWDFPTRWDMETGGFHGVPTLLYREQAGMIYHALRDTGYLVDAIGRESDWDRYKMLCLPALTIVGDDLARKILDYLHAGGHVVWHPFCGLKDSEAAIHPARLHPLMSEAFGINIDEFATAGPDQPVPFVWNDREYAGRMFCDLPVADERLVQGTFKDTWFAGTPAVLSIPVGDGRVHYTAAFGARPFYDDFLPHVARQAGVETILPGRIPQGVEICERRAKDGVRLIFLLNHSGEEQSVPLPVACRDVFNEEDVGGETVLGAYGVRVLRLR